MRKAVLSGITAYDEEESLNYYELAVFLPREDGLYEKCEEVHCQKGISAGRNRITDKEAGMDLLAVYDAYTMEPAAEDSGETVFCGREKKEKINKRGTERT